MSWIPSVRTRHLTVIISLVLVTAGTLLCFNLARLLSVQVAAKHDKFEALKVPIHNAVQQAIFSRPLEAPQNAIGFDSNLRSLIKAGVSNPKGFSYVALLSLDGAVIANADIQAAQQQGQTAHRGRGLRIIAVVPPVVGPVAQR
jgi:hypothetical protein